MGKFSARRKRDEALLLDERRRALECGADDLRADLEAAFAGA